MSKNTSNFLSLREARIRLTCNGYTLHADGFPSGPDTVPFPPFYKTGLCQIFNYLEARLPGLTCISVLGIWFQDENPPFYAMDLWVQEGEEGFYLPMSMASSLFQENGIPYYHKPLFC